MEDFIINDIEIDGLSLFRKQIEHHINRILNPFNGKSYYRVTNFQIINNRNIFLGDEFYQNNLLIEQLSVKEKSPFFKDDIIFFIPSNRFEGKLDDLFACKLALHSIASFIAHFVQIDRQEATYITCISLLAKNTIGIDNINDVLVTWEQKPSYDMYFKNYFLSHEGWKTNFTKMLKNVINNDFDFPPYDFKKLLSLTCNLQKISLLYDMECAGSA